jgi:UDPglucose 6-dehydrogenase
MIGTGYVGLVSGACFASLGHRVICVDKDENKIKTLKSGSIPIYEPGLAELVRDQVKKKRISFSTNLKDAVNASEIIFIAVGTPSLPDGGADLSFVEACTREVAQYATRFKLLVEKSTVPVQTGERIQATLSRLNGSGTRIEVASNPEFLREGSAIKDFLSPDRIVIGVQSKRAEKLLRELYAKVKAPMVVTDIKSAELIKHASNSFLSVKISYINAIAQICERVGADVSRVAEGMGLDRRIGKSFLSAGIGYGGSCFPKDVSAFIKISEKAQYDFKILKATEEVNSEQRLFVIHKLEDALWTFRDKTIAVLGLAFKPDTDDIRNAPAIDIITALLEKGATIKAYDPVASEKMKEIFPHITYGRSAYQVAAGADAVLLLTEWDEFRRLNLRKIRSQMKHPIFIDGRNLFDPAVMHRFGFNYKSIGRPAPERSQVSISRTATDQNQTKEKVCAS